MKGLSPRIAFCTTCKGRASHLERTLPRNLADNARYDNAVFVILDYNSSDGLLEYLERAHGCEIESGRLVVYSHREPGPFRMAHAKNMVHRLAILEGADILVNLDADNFTSSGVPEKPLQTSGGFAGWIAEQYRCEDDSSFFLWTNAKSVCGRARQGLAGRIAVSRNLFLKVGGYDERYRDWAPEDEDFKARIRRLGHQGNSIPDHFLYVIPHRDGLRFKEYPHAKPTAETEASALREIRDAKNTIANFGRFGAGTVFRNFDQDCPVYLAPLPTRIFGIGMHKTATTSLDAALNILGFDSAHWRNPAWARQIWREMKLEGRSITVERHYALSDLPIGILYRELDTAYPGSKFILSTRHEEPWLRSVENHWSYERNEFRASWDDDAFSHRLHELVYGRRTFDDAVFRSRYRRHNSDVMEYFRSRPGDLLVMNMDSGAGWRELAMFLNQPIPRQAYPMKFQTPKR